jgi:hypothetical protein
MKIVELKLEDDKNGEGITAISLVKNPAIEQNWIAFSKNGDMVAKPNKAFAFKTIDEEQRIIAGPAMIPDKLIYRQDPDGDEYFVFFNGTTIRELSERFLLQGKQNNMTLEHEATLNDLSVVESWIVEDSEKDKSAIYGFDLPVGSWFVKVKVLNDDVWGLVKGKSVAGFSVEGVFTRELIKNAKQKMNKETLDGYLNKIRSLFTTEETEKPTEETTEETQEQTSEKFGTVETEGANGVVVISFPGEILEVGVAITTVVDEAEVPVPTGEYTLSDGSVLVVVEEGVAGELRPAENTEETPEMEAEKSEGLKEEQVNALIDGIADIISKFQKQVGEDFARAIAENAEKLRIEFNKPAATVEDKTPEDVDKSKIIKGLSKFVREANKGGK